MRKKVDITSNYISSYAICKMIPFLQQIKLNKTVLKINKIKLSNSTELCNASLIFPIRKLSYFSYFRIEY